MDYPEDADGDALRRIARDGSDMAQPMRIDFIVAAPDEIAAKAIAKAAGGYGFSVRMEQDAESDRWSCTCTREMLATYPSVIAAQRELDELSHPLGGYCDGWGSFGNRS